MASKLVKPGSRVRRDQLLGFWLHVSHVPAKFVFFVGSSNLSYSAWKNATSNIEKVEVKEIKDLLCDAKESIALHKCVLEGEKWPLDVEQYKGA